MRNEIDKRTAKLVREMNGKTEEEITSILIREGILVPVEREKKEFHITYTKRNMFGEIKDWFTDLKLRIVARYLNWRIRRGDKSVIETINSKVSEGKLEEMW